MIKVILLLRGINVGSKKILKMDDLKSVFSREFSNVQSYINSGNLFFNANDIQISDLEKICKNLINTNFNLNIDLAVIKEEDLKNALDHSHQGWGNDDQYVHNTIFIMNDDLRDDVIESMIENKLDDDKVSYYGKLIFYSMHKDSYDRQRLSKLVSKKLLNSTTIRNANTTKKLLEISLKS